MAKKKEKKQATFYLKEETIKMLREKVNASSYVEDAVAIKSGADVMFAGNMANVEHVVRMLREKYGDKELLINVVRAERALRGE